MDGLGHNGVLDIELGQEGELWFGTGSLYAAGSGVSRYSGEQLRTFTTEEGLVRNNVVSAYWKMVWLITWSSILWKIGREYCGSPPTAAA